MKNARKAAIQENTSSTTFASKIDAAKRMMLAASRALDSSAVAAADVIRYLPAIYKTKIQAIVAKAASLSDQAERLASSDAEALKKDATNTGAVVDDSDVRTKMVAKITNPVPRHLGNVGESSGLEDYLFETARLPDGSSYDAVIKLLGSEDRNHTLQAFVLDYGGKKAGTAVLKALIADEILEVTTFSGKPCWRGMEIEKIEDLKSTGVFWSMDRSVARTFSYESALLKSFVDLKNIDWVGTISARLDLITGHHENEVRFLPDRSVFVESVWFKGKLIKFNKELPTEDVIEEGFRPKRRVLYHGTSASKAEQIKLEGLKPGKKGWSYLSSDPGQAYIYGDSPHQDDGTSPVLFEVNIDALDESKLGPDDDDVRELLRDEDDDREWHELTWKESLDLSGQCTYSGIIPPSALRVSNVRMQERAAEDFVRPHHELPQFEDKNYVIHVTREANLPKIAREGLVPYTPSGDFGGRYRKSWLDGDSDPRVFFGPDIYFTAIHAHGFKNQGVILRVPKSYAEHKEGVELWTSKTVPPSAIEVLRTDGWHKVVEDVVVETAADNTLVLYHGTSRSHAESMLAKGWEPRTGRSGPNGGRPSLLYLTNFPENAGWYADRTDDPVVLRVVVHKNQLVVDPEDGIGNSVDEELAMSARSKMPVLLAARTAIPAESFTMIDHVASSRDDDDDIFDEALNYNSPRDREARAKALEQRLPKLKNMFSKLSSSEIEAWIPVDPSLDLKYLQWLILHRNEGVVPYDPKAPVGQKRVPANTLRSVQALSNVHYAYPNIDVGRLKNWEHVVRIGQEGEDPETGKPRVPKIKWGQLVYEKDDVRIIKVEKPECLRAAAKNTEWCVKAAKTAREYLSAGAMYVIMDRSGKYLVDPSSGQFKNEDDDEIEVDAAQGLAKHVVAAGLEPAGFVERGWANIIALSGDQEAIKKHIDPSMADELLVLHADEFPDRIVKILDAIRKQLSESERPKYFTSFGDGGERAWVQKLVTDISNAVEGKTPEKTFEHAEGQVRFFRIGDSMVWVYVAPGGNGGESSVGAGEFVRWSKGWEERNQGTLMPGTGLYPAILRFIVKNYGPVRSDSKVSAAAGRAWEKAGAVLSGGRFVLKRSRSITEGIAFFSKENPINTGGKIKVRRLSGVTYHGSRVENPEDWFQDLERYSDMPVWVTPEESVAKSFSENAGGREDLFFVNKYTLSSLKTAELDVEAFEKIKDRPEFDTNEDMREELARYLEQKGYSAWLATGSVGLEAYEDIALFDPALARYEGTSFKQSDGNWTPYMDEEEARDWLHEHRGLPLDEAVTFPDGYSYRLRNTEPDGQEITVFGYYGKKRVGHVQCLLTPRKDLKPEATKDFENVCQQIGRDDVKIYSVWKSNVDEEHRGKHVGSSMYAAAVEECGKQGGILAASCQMDIGCTSEEARAVWSKSSRVREVAFVSGMVAGAKFLKTMKKDDFDRHHWMNFMKNRWQKIPVIQRDVEEFRAYLAKVGVPQPLVDEFMKGREEKRKRIFEASGAALDTKTVLQNYEYDCGAAILRSVASLVGIEMTQDDAITIVKPSKKDGLSADKLYDALKQMGVKCQLFQDMTLSLLRRKMAMGFPVVTTVHAYGGGHWVIAVGFHDGKYMFMDPYRGTVGYIREAEIEKRWKTSSDASKRLGIVVMHKRTSKSLDRVDEIPNDMLDEALRKDDDIRQTLTEPITVYHGTLEDRAVLVRADGVLKSTAGKLSGGHLFEKGLIWFATQLKHAEFYAMGSERRDIADDSKREGRVFTTTLHRGTKLIGRYTPLTAQEAEKINALNKRPYDPIKEGTRLESAMNKLWQHPQAQYGYDEVLKLIGFDGIIWNNGNQIGIAAKDIPARELKKVKMQTESFLCESAWEMAPEQDPKKYSKKPDGYYYHVTTSKTAPVILEKGLRPGMPDRWGHAAWSGKVFMSERGGVPFWHEFVETAPMDEQEEAIILRISKKKVKVPLANDLSGTRDSRHRAWFATDIVENSDDDILRFLNDQEHQDGYKTAIPYPTHRKAFNLDGVALKLYIEEDALYIDWIFSPKEGMGQRTIEKLRKRYSPKKIIAIDPIKNARGFWDKMLERGVIDDIMHSVPSYEKPDEQVLISDEEYLEIDDYYDEAVVPKDTATTIDSHISGNTAWVDMIQVPKERRGAGEGKKAYEDWEKTLPSNVRQVRLFAADTGAGSSTGFWEKMGFDYLYTSEDPSDIPYESRMMMRKAVNGAESLSPIPWDKLDEVTVPSKVPEFLYRGIWGDHSGDATKLKTVTLTDSQSTARAYALDGKKPRILKYRTSFVRPLILKDQTDGVITYDDLMKLMGPSDGKKLADVLAKRESWFDPEASDHTDDYNLPGAYAELYMILERPEFLSWAKKKGYDAVMYMGTFLDDIDDADGTVADGVALEVRPLDQSKITLVEEIPVTDLAAARR